MPDLKHVQPVLDELPISGLNPLLATKEFHTYCKSRLPQFAFEEALERYLRQCWEHDVARPAWIQDGHACYSTFQVWEVAQALSYGLTEHAADQLPLPRTLRGFDRLLAILIGTQNAYLPEVQSDLREGRIRRFPSAIVSGTHFKTTETYVLGTLRKRRQAILGHALNVRAVLEKAQVEPEELKEWYDIARWSAESIDPLEKWQDLVRLTGYEQRQLLKGDALLAQDFYEIAEHVALVAADLGIVVHDRPLLLWQETDHEPSDSPEANWRVRAYGSDNLCRPYELLEFLTNRFKLNPKPRAIVLTEGDEWQALAALYREIGAPPEQLGLEFRSLGGHGNFSLQNWQFFVEYMHEKQVLVYFVLDREGNAARETRRLLRAKRRFDAAGLTKVIPESDRILVWKSSFEEANFSDSEIAAALKLQGISINYQRITAIRRSNRTKALVNTIADALGVEIDKPRLCRDLVARLISIRQAGGRRALTDVERFVDQSANLIVLNHQPTHPGSRARNRASGLLG